LDDRSFFSEGRVCSTVSTAYQRPALLMFHK